MFFRGVTRWALTVLGILSVDAQAAPISALVDGVAQDMPAANRLIGGGTLEGRDGARFGVDGNVSIRAVDEHRSPANFFFGLTSSWTFGNPAESSWSGSPPFATTGLYDGSLIISFDTPQAAVLGRFNWATPGSLKAFSSSGALLETLSFAPDTGRLPGFYGFRRSTIQISRIEVSGFNIGVRSLSTLTQVDVVPEPASWALMIGGFGLAGASMRRRRISISHA